MIPISPLSRPLTWAAAACLAGAALVWGAAGAGGHVAGDENNTAGPCLFDGLPKGKVSFYTGERFFNSSEYEAGFGVYGISPLGQNAIRHLGAMAGPYSQKNCGGEGTPANEVAKWLFEKYNLSEVTNYHFSLKTVDDLQTPSVETGWAIIAANYRGLMSVKSDSLATPVDEAVAMTHQPLLGKDLSFLFYNQVEDGERTRVPYIPDVNPHIGQLLEFPEPNADNPFQGLGGSDNLGPHDLQPVGSDKEGVAQYIQDSAGSNDIFWERAISVARGDIEFEINAEDGATNWENTKEYWTVQDLFIELGKMEDTLPGGMLEGATPGGVGRLACVVEYEQEGKTYTGDATELLSWGIPPSDSATTSGSIPTAETTRRGNRTPVDRETAEGWKYKGIQSWGSANSRLAAAENLWDAWITCQVLAAIGIVDAPGDRHADDVGLQKMIEDGGTSQENVLASLLAATAPSGDAAQLNRHVYSDDLLERARLPLPCGGLGLFEEESDGHKYGVAGLCRYQMYTDSSSFLGVVNPVEYGQLWVGNMGLWVNRTAMEGMVWITRNIYMFGLADDAIGGMAAIFTPLNEWLSAPVEVRDRNVEQVGLRQREGKDPVPETRVVPDPIFVETKRLAAEQGIPRWVFWGLGVFMTFFVAFQLIRGKTAVAGKELLISLVAGSVLFWMVSAELSNPGSWYRTVGGAAINTIRGVTDITFGEGDRTADIGVLVYYEPPPNFYPDEAESSRMLRWTNASCDWLAADCGDDDVPGFPDVVTELKGDAAKKEETRQKRAWLGWAKNRDLWRRADAIEAMRLWKFEPPSGGWSPGWPAAEGSRWPGDDDFDNWAEAAKWREDADEDNLLGLSNRRRITETRSGRLADELGEVLGRDALSGLYNRVQWGYALEGEEWRYCRERAWAALVRGERGDGGKSVRSYMDGDFQHSLQVWPPTAGAETSYRPGGFFAPNKGALRSASDPCGDGEEQTITPAKLASWSSDMPIERTMGPWLAAIPTVVLFVALVLNAVPILVAQFLLAILFALMPVIALIAIMPGRARSGLFKWVGHILRAVLTILFGVVFVILSVWILKAVYLLPGSGFWQDLLVGIAGAAAIWKLRGGMWRGATQVAAKAASGLGRAVGSKSEVSFKGDKLGEKFVREKATAVNKKRQDALRRYEAGRGKIVGGWRAGGALFSPGFTRVGHARARAAKQERKTASGQAAAATALRKTIAGMSDEQWKEAKKDNFAELRERVDLKDMFVEDDKGNVSIRGNRKFRDALEGTGKAGDALLHIRGEETKYRKKAKEARQKHSVHRRLPTRATFHQMASIARTESRLGRQKARDRLAAAHLTETPQFTVSDERDDWNRSRGERHEEERERRREEQEWRREDREWEKEKRERREEERERREEERERRREERWEKGEEQRRQREYWNEKKRQKDERRRNQEKRDGPS